MLTVALALASIAAGPVAPGSVRLVRTDATQVTFSVRNRGASAGSSLSKDLVEALPTRSVSEFLLRGRSEVNPEGWQQAVESYGDDTAGKIGLAHAMTLAEAQTRDPVRYHVPAITLPRGAFQDTDFGLRGFDLTVQNGGAPIRVARYWLPETEPLDQGLVISAGYRMPGGDERSWGYRDGGWRIDTPQGAIETPFAPPSLSVARTGIDLNNVRYRIQNNTDEPVAGILLPGQVLVPGDSDTQRMVTISRERFAVPPAGQIDLDVRAACLDMGKKEPTPGTVFGAAPNPDPVLANLANVTANSPFLGPWNQAMFWIHTDGASMEQINQRLGLGVSPFMYQQAAAQVAMHGGLDPLDSKYEPVFRSLANPRGILMGMQPLPGLTSMFAPNLASQAGAKWLREAAGQVPELAEGLTLNALQQESVAKTCGNLLWSGDPELTFAGLNLATSLEAKYQGFVQRPEVRYGLEFARCSPDYEIRKAAWWPGAMPELGSLAGFVHNVESAARSVRTALASLRSSPASEPWSEPAGFSINLEGVPDSIQAGETVPLAVQTAGGTALSVAYGYQVLHSGAPQAIANVEGSARHAWTVALQGTHVAQLRAQAVSTDGQIAISTVPVMFNAPANLRADIADALRRAREARSRETRARAEAQRHALRYAEIVASLREHWKDLQALQTADRDLLDGLEGRFKALIEGLLARNQSLGGGAPPNAKDVDKAAEDAQKAEDDCKKELEDLKKQKADCDKEMADLTKAIDAILGEVDAIYTGAGFTGGTGHHSAGTGWFGYVGLGGGLPPAQNQRVNELGRDLRAKNRQFRAADQRCKDLDAAIKAKEKECAELEKRNKEAQEAKAKKDEIAANNAQIGQAWDDIAKKLQDLADTLKDVEGGEGLAGEAEGLAGKMPTDQAGWDAFWQRLRNLINRKKQLEAQLEQKIKDERDAAKRERDAKEQAERDAENAADEAGQATSEAGAKQDEADKQPPAAGAPDPNSTPPAQANPCVEKFAAWLKKYQDKMDKSQYEKFRDTVLGAAQTAQVPGIAVGEAIAGGGKALASGASSATAGMTAVASGFLSLGAGLFYAYAQSQIAAALGPLGSKIRMQRVAALAAIDGKPCGEVGAGGVTGSGSESFFYFKVGSTIIVFRGGESGVEFVGARPAM